MFNIPRNPVRTRRRVIAVAAGIALAALATAGIVRAVTIGDAINAWKKKFGQVLPDAPSIGVGLTTTNRMPGDTRLAGGDEAMALRPDEEERAARAGELFGRVVRTQRQASELNYDLYIRSISEPQRAALAQVLTRYADVKSPGPVALAEIRLALLPFVVAYNTNRAAERGVGAIVVSPNSAREFGVTAYSSDRRAQPLVRDEPLQLVPLGTLVPDDLTRTYFGLLGQGMHLGATQHDPIQELLWTVRDATAGEVHTLTPTQAQLLSQADPQSLAALQKYYAAANNAKTTGKVLDMVKGLPVSRGAEQQLSRALNSQSVAIASKVADVLGSTAPVVGPARSIYAGYSLLRDDLAVHAISDGSSRSLHIGIANASPRPALFLPGSCIAQPLRAAQRLTLQGPGIETRVSYALQTSTLVDPTNAFAAHASGVCGFLAWGAQNGHRFGKWSACGASQSNDVELDWEAISGAASLGDDSLGMVTIASCQETVPTVSADAAPKTATPVQ